MTTNQEFLSQLEVEARRTRRALERVPEGREDWAPHPRSMPLGRLVTLVARMPGWFTLMIQRDELDLSPVGGSNLPPKPLRTRAELLQAFDDDVAAARAAFATLDDARLRQPWRLLVAGNVVSEDPRHVVIRDTFMHLAHHRGQLTVYLRLNDVPVPAIYGPSADENRFA